MVDLPTPPFPLMTMMVCLMRRSLSLSLFFSSCFSFAGVFSLIIISGLMYGLFADYVA
jgi:ABC-type lipoprotein release transport system permease subunit